ncbi:MAG: ABC transporter permease [Anaerolineae bacterium]|jgi:peptide/nickel transport system permease protein|nr:ABC transporter permease [Chloroflexota bacterium]
MIAFLKSLGQLKRYPSAVGGIIIIILLIALAVYAVSTIPYSEAIRLWRGGEDVWGESPRLAAPVWVDWFNRQKMSHSIIVSSLDGTAERTETDGGKTQLLTFPVHYAYDNFPEEIVIFFTSHYADKPPHVALKWYTPDGREIRITETSAKAAQTYRPGQDSKLTRRLKGTVAEMGFFQDPESETRKVLKGDYKMVMEIHTFEQDSTVDAKLVMHGQVSGLAGTDDRRRDLMVALLWGTPVALAFGLLAALGTSVTTMIIAAIGVWYGKWIDATIQRVTEVNMILPFLPILIMVGTLYTRSIWVILGMSILLSIFGSGIKSYRAVFMQVKESPYIEAAKAYGASDLRIIFRYMIPRVIPMLIPQLVTAIPSFVFLEASLALLGLADPVLPTWGKVINDARSQGALFHGQYYWMLEPAVLLMLTGLGFAMLGFALDRIFNPRLRGL